MTFSGVIQDPTGMDATTYTVTKAGLGTVVLSNANTYTGATTVQAGTLKLAGAAARAQNTSAVNITSAGATLVLDSGVQALAISGGTDIANVGTFEVAALGGVNGTVAQQVGDVSGTGGTTRVNGALTANSIVQDTLIIGAGGSVTICEVAVSGAAGAVPVPEPGAWVLLGIGLLSLLAFRRRR